MPSCRTTAAVRRKVGCVGKGADSRPGLVRHAYEDLPSYWLIDSNLARGNPVIVRVHLANGITHFVVRCTLGKAGFDSWIRTRRPAEPMESATRNWRGRNEGIEIL